MGKRKGNSRGEAGDLRKRAEARLRPEDAEMERLAKERPQRLIHELRVHQVELEMQNEDLRQSQLSLEEARERYADLFDRAPVGYFVLDKDGLIAEANLTAAAMLGVGRRRLVGNRLDRFVAPESADDSFLHRRSVFDEGEAKDAEIWFAGKNRPRFAAHVHSQPVTDARGKVIQCRSSIIDITARKEAQAKIHDLARFPEENPNPVLRADGKGMVLYANKAGADLLADMGWKEGQPLPVEFLEPVRQSLQEGGVEEFEYTCASQRVFSFAASAGGAQGDVNIYGRDITRRAAATEALRERIKEMTCLYAVSRDIQEDLPAAELLPRVVGHLVSAMQFPDITAPVIEVNGNRFTSGNYSEALSHGLHAEIRMKGRVFGRLTVYYTEARDFLIPEEQNLVNAVAEAISIWLDRKKAEGSLRESREDLNRAQAVAHTGSWRLDVKKNVLTWSDETYRIFERPKDEPQTYESFIECVHPDDRKYVDEKWQAALRGEDYDIEHRLLVGGKVKWVREKAYMEFDDDWNLLGGFGIAQDITERKLAEEELRRSNEELNRFNKVAVGREMRIIEMKKEVNELCERLGRPRPYPLEFLEEEEHKENENGR